MVTEIFAIQVIKTIRLKTVCSKLLRASACCHQPVNNLLFPDQQLRILKVRKHWCCSQNVTFLCVFSKCKGHQNEFFILIGSFYLYFVFILYVHCYIRNVPL